MNVGLVIGGVLAFGAAILWRRSGTDTFGPGGLFGSVQVASVAFIFLAGPSLTRWLNRDMRFHNLGGQYGNRSPTRRRAFRRHQRLPARLRLCLWLDAVHRPDSRPPSWCWPANTETISRGIFLLAIYSAGLAVPFLLTAIGINQFLRFYQRFRRHLHTVEVLSGVLLLFVGALIS